MVSGPPPRRGKLLLLKRAALKGTHKVGPTILILPLLVVADTYSPLWAELHFTEKDITSYDL